MHLKLPVMHAYVIDKCEIITYNVIKGIGGMMSMLRRFNVKNVLSYYENEYGESEEFSLIPGKVRNKSDHLFEDKLNKLLKFSAIYGANASGKSNLVKALKMMQNITVNSDTLPYAEDYCKIKEDNKLKPSYFEMEIYLNGVCYDYGFEVILSLNRFVSEWLVEKKTDNSEKVIFEREDEKVDISDDLNIDLDLKYKLEVFSEGLDSDQLFLYTLNKGRTALYEKYPKISLFKEVYDWIRDSLIIIFPDTHSRDYHYLRNSEDVKVVTSYLKAFKTGISDVAFEEVPLETIFKGLSERVREDMLTNFNKVKIALNENIGDPKKYNMFLRTNNDFFIVEITNDNMHCETIEFKHKFSDSKFHLYQESDGTIRLLDLLEVLITKENKTFVIDELDRCLHPMLTYKYIEEFLDKKAKKSSDQSQLIVTTHESRLMDFDLLRRDEIWFVDKNNTGRSNIYSLEEYNTRFDQKVDKAYLDGRYGGVPIFNSIFPVDK